jgi:valyl-tRNA synthetase
MLADMAVAVNPEDERYKSVIGKEILQPITGRRFRIVADEHADPELGSGAVKITPGHDFNDFEVGKRAGSPPTPCSTCSMPTPMWCRPPMAWCLALSGRRAFRGAPMVVAEMKELGFLIPHITKDKEGNAVEHDAEPRTIQTPFGDRGGVVIEPWLTDQWYVNAAVLAQKPIEAVKAARSKSCPRLGKDLLQLDGKHPAVVRPPALVGHRIRRGMRGWQRSWPKRGGSAGAGGQQGPDPRSRRARHLVLLALWPFATLGWPDETRRC